MTCEEERSLVLNRRMVGGIAQEIDARSEILRIEKELEEARGRLNAIRQAKYKMRGDTYTSGDDTDTDVTLGRVPARPRTPNSSYINTTYSPNSTYSAHNTHNTTNLSQHISHLDQSIHGPSSPGFQNIQNQGLPSPGYIHSQNLSSPGYQTHGQNFSHTGQNFSQTSHGQNISSPGYQTHGQNSHSLQNTSHGQNVQTSQNMSTHSSNGYSTLERKHDEKQYTVQSPTFSSFRPQEEPKQNYEGFTTRSMEETVTVRSLQLPEVRTAVLVAEDHRIEGHRIEGDRIYYRRERPPPPPRRASLLNYETRLYDAPRNEYSKTEEQKQYETNFYKKEYGYDAPKLSSPLSPKFNARDLKFDDKEHIYSTIKKPTDGVGQSFTEHQKSTEVIPGGTKQTEYTMKSESYQSYPQTEYIKTETKTPFATSTPSKFEKSDYNQEYKQTSTDLVKAATPDYDRISSPYGKEVHSHGGPNFMEETTTEVKEIPNGTQKVTTTKIYSSSPVNLTTTNTKYEPVKLEGIDELSKSFDNDSRYSTLDSRFNTLESKLSSDTSRSFMRPSEFQSDVSHTMKKDLSKEIDNLDKKFSKSTIKSETIERKSVMTSSHKSETSSTVTKKFGNF